MSSKHPVLHIDPDFNPFALDPAEEERYGMHIVNRQCHTAEETIAAAREIEAVAVTTILQPIEAAVIEALPSLRAVMRVGVGVDNVAVDTATERGVAVMNVPDYCMDEVSNHALAFLFALARSTVIYDRAIRSGTWNWRLGQEMNRLEGRVLGLVAFGKIARTLVPKARALGMRVLAYDPYLADDIFPAFGAERVLDLHAMLAQADYVSCHLPLTDETRGMMGARAFEAMKPSAYFINTSRGAVVDFDALYEALAAGSIAGAGADVMPTEPPDLAHPLFQLDNFVGTPHAAWYSEESRSELLLKALEDLERYFKGERPKNLVNPEVLRKS